MIKNTVRVVGALAEVALWAPVYFVCLAVVRRQVRIVPRGK
jgi:hypothetical protein